VSNLKLSLFFLACTAWGATRQASSCAIDAVQSAVNAAAQGDIVTVPAGNCSWSGLTLNKPIRLQGAGIGQTNITLTGVNNITKSSGIIRISGFSFTKNGGGNESKGFVIGGSWKGAEPVIIESNTFKISNSGLFRINVAGGVILAKNSFTAGWDEQLIQLKNGSDSDRSWATADTLGNKDTTGKLNHYIEDNTFYGATNGNMDADDGSRVVYRYNDLTFSSVNSHGWDTSAYGVRHFEIYNNTFRHNGGCDQIANQNWSIWMRGGTGVIFNNQFANIAGSCWGDKPEIKFSIRGAEDVRPQGSCSNTRYPTPHQLGQNYNGTSYFTDPIYMWGNTGTAAISAAWTWGNPCGFNFADFFKWGRDAVNSGTPKPGYTTYAYPHPLRAGNPDPAPQPTPPSPPSGLSATAK
jgi:hypothetical protein